MKIHITGIAGVLGSNLAKTLVSNGYKVSGNDVVRPEDAWRLKNMGVFDLIDYQWMSTEGLENVDYDIIIDAGIAVPDRDFGNNNVWYTLDNIRSAVSLLEKVRRSRTNPVIIYPSSFNSLYGYGKKTYRSNMLPNPTSIYGWSKGAVEQLYLTYHRMYGTKVIITRVGSAYGPYMRTTELIGKVIVYALRRSKFKLYSPESKRLWTYSGDVSDFYLQLIPRANDWIGKVIHCAGNKGMEIYRNYDLVVKIYKMLGLDEGYVERMVDYEPGELIDGKPVDFNTKVEVDWWKPRTTIEEGLKKTIEWFEVNLNTKGGKEL